MEIYHHQFLWDNRQERRVYDAFVDVWDREDLWVAIDRANLNPPNKADRFTNGFIHWDVDTSIFPGDPREWEKKHAEIAKLTPLGERLLGLRSWKDEKPSAVSLGTLSATI